MNPLMLTVILLATLPICLGVANFNLVATLLGVLFLGLAIAVGFSFFMWAGVAFWLAGFAAVVLAIQARERQHDIGSEGEPRNRELMVAIQAWANPQQADASQEIPLGPEAVEAQSTAFQGGSQTFADHRWVRTSGGVR